MKGILQIAKLEQLKTAFVLYDALPKYCQKSYKKPQKCTKNDPFRLLIEKAIKSV
ncbi:hypothetical protein [Candidatus Avelusimicrobium fimicolum]|jgi:hypothetical protein|uniref:hypothetical protein n=1 Tax=Candidatus Avelusimicrobium fimicolum TaxID=3416216 RepID=UPI003D0D61B8